MAKRRRQATRHGYVVIDKPAGWTSHDVVARVRRLVNERRVGHAGTLDPAATGVLPVAVGLATRTVEYLADASKAYRAWIRFGVTTDSADADSAITCEVDASNLTLETLMPILDSFRGQIRQRPPMHSAISVGGTRLYDLARRGVEIDVPVREVTIHALSVVSWESPVLCLDVECSKGTYIRALARDIGELAGTGAHLARLVRTRSGPFTLDDAMSLEHLESELATAGGWERISLAPDTVLDGLPRLDLDRDEAIDWGHGKPVPFAEAEAPDGAPVRAYDREGRWLGIGTIDREHGVVRPAKVIATEQGRHVSKAVYRSFRDVPTGPHIVSIGTFDGVHLGHRYLLQQAAARAADLGLPLLVATFEPNPAQVIRPDTFPGRISTPEDKLARLFAASAGEVLVIPFTEDLMRATPEDFLAQLVDAAHPREVWVGEGFALGYKRSGDIARLTAIGEDLGFALHAVPRRELGGDIVSSSRIRQHLLEGAPDAAARLLGAPYRLSGEVIHGAQVGRTIGFPTANVEPPEQMAQLPDGIYATRASIGDGVRQHQAMTYIGTRPALNTGARQIETHILDFDGDLYGKVLHTDFVDRLRPDADFPSVDALIAQLKRDEAQARDVLASAGGVGETVPEAASGH